MNLSHSPFFNPLFFSGVFFLSQLCQIYKCIYPHLSICRCMYLRQKNRGDGEKNDFWLRLNYFLCSYPRRNTRLKKTDHPLFLITSGNEDAWWPRDRGRPAGRPVPCRVASRGGCCQWPLALHWCTEARGQETSEGRTIQGRLLVRQEVPVVRRRVFRADQDAGWVRYSFVYLFSRYTVSCSASEQSRFFFRLYIID